MAFILHQKPSFTHLSQQHPVPDISGKNCKLNLSDALCQLDARPLKPKHKFNSKDEVCERVGKKPEYDLSECDKMDLD
jgi:hypothetical protein